MTQSESNELAPLAERSCKACRGGMPALKGEEWGALLAKLSGWKVIEGHHLVRDFQFSNFVEALAFTNKAGDIAEEQGHHPEITVGWGHAKVVIWTHKIDALSESDFILAAKFNRI